MHYYKGFIFDKHSIKNITINTIMNYITLFKVYCVPLTGVLGNTCLFKKEKKRKKCNSMHINSNSITYIIRKQV